VSTLQAMQELNPKRVDWVYYDNDQILREYKKRGLPFSLAVNPQIPDSSGYRTSKYRIKDYKGAPYTAPWMKDWKIKNPYWGCVNNPGSYNLFLDQSLFLANKVPYALLVDDALFDARLKKEKLAGCFCDFCINKFKKQNQDFDNQDAFEELKLDIASQLKGKAILSTKGISDLKRYQEFQEQSVIEFLENWQIEVKRSYPKMIFLTDNFNGDWNAIYKTFDGEIAEIKPNKINKKDLDHLYHLADSLHKTQVFSIATENKELHFRLMEYNAINNRETLLSWDIYISGKTYRYYMPYDLLKKKMGDLINFNLKN
jgi:hypothetical protein